VPEPRALPLLRRAALTAGPLLAGATAMAYQLAEAF
jgi:hypothetical protein